MEDVVDPCSRSNARRTEDGRGQVCLGRSDCVSWRPLDRESARHACPRPSVVRRGMDREQAGQPHPLASRHSDVILLLLFVLFFFVVVLCRHNVKLRLCGQTRGRRRDVRDLHGAGARCYRLQHQTAPHVQELRRSSVGQSKAMPTEVQRRSPARDHRHGRLYPAHEEQDRYRVLRLQAEDGAGQLAQARLSHGTPPLFRSWLHLRKGTFLLDRRCAKQVGHPKSMAQHDVQAALKHTELYRAAFGHLRQVLNAVTTLEQKAASGTKRKVCGGLSLG